MNITSMTVCESYSFAGFTVDELFHGLKTKNGLFDPLEQGS